MRNKKPPSISIKVGAPGFYLAFILMILKVANIVPMPWWVVAIPIWLPFSIMFIMIMIVFIVMCISFAINRVKY